MTTPTLKRAFLSAAILLASCFAAFPSNNTLSPAEIKAGWILLFDGADKNAHWRSGETGTTNNWKISAPDSALASVNTGVNLFTKEKYDNFEFSWDWKLVMAGNSGVFFRVSDTAGWICSSAEYQLLDNVNAVDRVQLGYMPGETGMFIHRTASSYDMYPTRRSGSLDSPYVDWSLPYTQWNHGEIFANGTYVEHWINGKKVVDYQVGSADWIARFNFSKFNTSLCSAGQRTTWGRYVTGLLGLQDHGDTAKFRNLKVRPFTPGEKLVTPLITPAGGTFSKSTKVTLETAIIGSIIHYTLDGSDPVATSPVYTDTLTVAASATIKAKTFRPRFTTSDAASEVFVIGGSSILEGTAFYENNLRLTLSGGSLVIRNYNATPAKIEILSIDGKHIADFVVGRGTSLCTPKAIHSALYVARVIANGQIRTILLASDK